MCAVLDSTYTHTIYYRHTHAMCAVLDCMYTHTIYYRHTHAMCAILDSAYTHTICVIYYRLWHCKNLCQPKLKGSMVEAIVFAFPASCSHGQFELVTIFFIYSYLVDDFTREWASFHDQLTVNNYKSFQLVYKSKPIPIWYKVGAVKSVTGHGLWQGS